MSSITYILQFRGKGTPGSDPSKLKIKAAADSLNASTAITNAGVTSTLEVYPSNSASFESDVTFASATSFQESGTIRFPGGHVLNFSTVGQGIIGASATSGTQSGSGSGRLKAEKDNMLRPVALLLLISPLIRRAMW